MADKVKKADEEVKDEAGKVVAYKMLEDMGDLKAGEIVHLPEEKGAKLVEAGLAEHASSEDMGGDEEVEDEENAEEFGESPVVMNAVKKLETKLAAGVAKAIARPITAPKVAATIKEPTYKSVGAFVRGVIKADIFGDKTEKNRVAAYQDEAARAWGKRGMVVKSPLGINETTNSQGGYLVNPEFSPDVYAIPHDTLDLLSLCQPIEAKSNVYNQRFINESSLANGSIFGGLNMVATAEGATFTSSLPAWSNVAFTLQKFGIFVYYTMEILQDASYPVEAELNDYAGKAFIYGLNTQLVQGSTIEGLLNTPALVTVTSSSNDTAWHTTPSTALTYADLVNIMASVYPDSKKTGVWLFHPSLAQCLLAMTYTFSGSNPAWGISYDAQAGLQGMNQGMQTPYKIFGRPAYECWACSAPGVAGDIIFCDFDTVKHYKKPYRVEVSKEFQFGSDQICVRFVNRLDAKTIFRNKVTGPNGTQSFSSVVTRSGSGT